MHYPSNIFFDIETLINVAQPQRILLLGDCEPGFLNDYLQQKRLLNQTCDISHIKIDEINSLWDLNERFDVGLIVNLFEHIGKVKGQQILSRMRDVLCSQYCLCLPLRPSNTTSDGGKTDSERRSEWELADLFSFALSKVASYESDAVEYGLFKYNINDYKNTPDWLNADNWANPKMWEKYRW